MVRLLSGAMSAPQALSSAEAAVAAVLSLDEVDEYEEGEGKERRTTDGRGVVAALPMVSARGAGFAVAVT